MNRQDREFLHRLAQALTLVAPGNPADIGAVARHSQQADQLLQRVRRLLRELYWDGHTTPSADARAQLEAIEALARKSA